MLKSGDQNYFFSSVLLAWDLMTFPFESREAKIQPFKLCSKPPEKPRIREFPPNYLASWLSLWGLSRQLSDSQITCKQEATIRGIPWQGMDMSKLKTDCWEEAGPHLHTVPKVPHKCSGKDGTFKYWELWQVHQENLSWDQKRCMPIGTRMRSLSLNPRQHKMRNSILDCWLLAWKPLVSPF